MQTTLQSLKGTSTLTKSSLQITRNNLFEVLTNKARLPEINEL